MKTDPQLIDIEDDDRQDDRPVEVPVFSIETVASPAPGQPADVVPSESPRRRSWVKWGVATFIAAALIVCGLLLWIHRYDFAKPELSSVVSDADNIALLRQPYTPSAKGTVATSDSVLGVAFDMYSLSGLRASLEREMPDTADKSLVLFMRSADYHPDGATIGTLVVDGDRIKAKERKSRPAYLAISKEGQIALGISLSDKLSDYAASEGGSFFRQYALLGDGELPSKFHLHGKVERAAIGRMTDGSMFYIVTRHKETMYDFADAMREYGFADAVYITGGNAYSFHRTSDGKPHIPSNVREKYEKYHVGSACPSPLLVFRTN